MKRPLPWAYRNGPALILFAIVFGGLYLIARRDLPPKRRVVRDEFARVDVTASKPYELEWPRRGAPMPAPPLGMWVPWGALGGWGYGDGERVMKLSPFPNSMRLYAALPDPEGLSVKALGNWCPEGLAHESCAIAQLHIAISPEAPDRSAPGFEVMESRARGFSDLASSGPYRKLNAFWAREMRETGRLEFVGWDCQEEPPTGVVSTDVSKPITERNRCFEPATQAERRMPLRAGYSRHVQLTACSGKGLDCKIYFSYRGRYVEVVPADSPMTAKMEESTGFIFLASWEFLNRLRQDARMAPPPQTHLARAARALENCADILRVAGAPDRSNRDAVYRFTNWHCRDAVEHARLALEERPVEASALMRTALATGSWGSDRYKSAEMQAAVEALRKAGHAESVESIEARLAVARYSMSPQGNAPQRAALEEALHIADKALPPGSPTRAGIYRELTRSMSTEKDRDAKIALLRRWNDEARAAGITGKERTEPLEQLCWAYINGRQQQLLKVCADEYLPLWQALLAKTPDGPLPDDVAAGGIQLVTWYGSYGLSQDKPLEVHPTMKRIASVVQPRVSAAVWNYQAASVMRYVEERIARTNGRRRTT